MIFRILIKSSKLLFLGWLVCLFSYQSYANKLDSLLALEPTLKNDTNKVYLQIQLANEYLENDFVRCIKYCKQAIKLAEQLDYEGGRLDALSTLSIVYDNIGRYSESQKLNYEILAVYEKNNNIEGMNNTYNNIGIIHYYLGNYEQSINYTKKALHYYELEHDSEGVAMCYNNLANSYSDQGDNDQALGYYFKALGIFEAMNDLSGVSLIKGNVGEVYMVQKKYDEAFTLLIDALQAAEKIKDEWQQANILNALGDLLSEQNKPDEAINFLLQALNIMEQIGAKAELEEIYGSISKVFEQKGDYIQSLHYLKLKNKINDDLFTKENSGAIAEMDALYEISDKEKELLKEQAKAALASSRNTAIIIGSTIGFLLLLIIVGISIKGNINKKKTNLTLENQKKQIEAKNRDITDSIQYAQRIQAAILPSDSILKKYLTDSFILYIPKDIVAGDFYWLEKQADKILFAAADCTGHGVPGAMVSVVCHNALNRALREFNLTEPAKILDKVTQLVINTFDHSDANIKDGMDIALCTLDTKTNKLEYAGANNSLYIIRNDELIETKSDKQPIGKYSTINPFTNHKIEVKKDDQIYLFTDGYADQFGGEKGKKFKYKQFKELLLNNHNKPMQDQLNRLTSTFTQWKGDLEQIDDVCVIGLKI